MPLGSSAQGRGRPTVLMLLTNAYDPDPRVRQEALALTRMGCQVELLVWDRDGKRPPRERSEGIEIERIFLPSTHGRGNTQLFFYAWLYLKMFWRGWRRSFDLIHCHDLDTLPLGWALAALSRKPLVYDAHESFPEMLDGSVHAAVKWFLFRLEDALMRRASVVITVGERLKRRFDARGAARVAVVGNWKSLSEFSIPEPENLATRRRLGIPADALMVVCITNLFKERKLEELLQAVEETPGVYALIGGKGALEGLVTEHAARNPRIVYAGFVSGRDIARYTCAGDIVYYGFDPDNPNAQYSAPNKLFEALAAGRPLITGDFGEIADVVRKAACGVILPAYTAGAIREALLVFGDRAAREQMGANAGRFGRAYMNWEKGEEILYQEYTALLPANRRPLCRAGQQASPIAASGN